MQAAIVPTSPFTEMCSCSSISNTALYDFYIIMEDNQVSFKVQNIRRKWTV